MTISIVTPWRGCPELIQSYEQSVRGAQVVIIDNGSAWEVSHALMRMVDRLQGTYIRNEQNLYFAAANNQGYARATGDIVLFLNNDILAPEGWLTQVERDTFENALCSPSRGMKMVDGQALCYLEGWCLAGRQETWERIRLDGSVGPWDAGRFILPYWDDNDVCFRATLAGIRLIKTTWPIQHMGGTTTQQTPEAQTAITTNERVFKARVRELWHEHNYTSS